MPPSGPDGHRQIYVIRSALPIQNGNFCALQARAAGRLSLLQVVGQFHNAGRDHELCTLAADLFPSDLAIGALIA